MKAISLHRPWPYFIEWGWKTIETREHDMFAKLAGHRIAIHAAMEWDADWYAKVRDFIDLEQKIQKPDGTEETVYDRIHRPLMGRPAWRPEIVCTCDVLRFERMLTYLDSKAAMIDCGKTMRSGLVLGNVLSRRPRVPYVGKLGIFDVDLSAPQYGFTRLKPEMYDILCFIRDHDNPAHIKVSNHKEHLRTLFRMGIVDRDDKLTEAGRVALDSYECNL